MVQKLIRTYVTGAGIYGRIIRSEITQRMSKYCKVFQADVYQVTHTMCVKKNCKTSITGGASAFFE